MLPRSARSSCPRLDRTYLFRMSGTDCARGTLRRAERQAEQEKQSLSGATLGEQAMREGCRALVVDDDDALRVIAAQTLTQDGWSVMEAASGVDVPTIAREHAFDLVVLDQRLPDGDGIDLLKDLRDGGFTGPAVVITGYPTMQSAIEALGSAATDYLCKPVEPAELLRISRRVVAGGGSGEDWGFLWDALAKRFGFSNVLSRDPSTRDCYITAARVAASRASVLIEGETGTGKEYLARAIHYMSDRREGPFVAVNCGAIPDTLLESELFGHEKGAFTSASAAKKGLCEMADGGTLLLDEVGELSPTAQVKLLRFLQDRQVTRLGGIKPIDVDVRVLAATNRDLLTAIGEERFREDLYYRVAVVPLTLPPLRQRTGDIPLFAQHFLESMRRETGSGPKEFETDAMERLQSHDWPGNLRELNNVVQRCALLAHGSKVRGQHVRLNTRHADADRCGHGAEDLRTLAEIEKEHIGRALEATSGSARQASEILGISSKELRAKAAEYGLPAPG